MAMYGTSLPVMTSSGRSGMASMFSMVPRSRSRVMASPVSVGARRHDVLAVAARSVRSSVVPLLPLTCSCAPKRIVCSTPGCWRSCSARTVRLSPKMAQVCSPCAAITS